ncbi:hypothetical protein Hanom_Chr00s116537g01809921 [Helianthus anomalus]
MSRLCLSQLLEFCLGGIANVNWLTKCESQIEDSWRSLNAWKSGYKSYLNKKEVLFQSIRIYPYKHICNGNLGFPMYLLFIIVWCFTLINYFLTMALMYFLLPI